MFCVACGSKNPDEARFCHQCGKRVAQVEDANPRPSESPDALVPDSKGRSLESTVAGVDPDSLYKAAIGEKNQHYYLAKFHDFDRQGRGLRLTWNWPAFLLNVPWALYRKMYAVCGVWLVLCVLFGILEKPLLRAFPSKELMVGSVWLAIWALFAALANSLYHAQVKAQIAAVQKANLDAARTTRILRAKGGVHSWVPIVAAAVPVIGIIAAITIPLIDRGADGRVATLPASPRSTSPFAYDEAVAKPTEPTTFDEAQAKPWEQYQPQRQDVAAAQQAEHRVEPAPYQAKVAALRAQLQQGGIPTISGVTSRSPPINVVRWSASDTLALERSQTWWTESSGTSFIHMLNPTGTELSVVALEYGVNRCGQNPSPSRFYLYLEVPLEPGRQAVVPFRTDAVLAVGCLDIAAAWK